MIYVFDASFVGALIIPNEKNQQVDESYANIENDEKKYAPFLFWYEITNIFKSLILRKRFTIDEVMYFYPRLAAISVNFDNESGIEYSKKILHLCSDYKLSSYDATYLELAERKNATLCTMDEKLRVAAKNYGVKVIR